MLNMNKKNVCKVNCTKQHCHSDYSRGINVMDRTIISTLRRNLSNMRTRRISPLRSKLTHNVLHRFFSSILSFRMTMQHINYKWYKRKESAICLKQKKNTELMFSVFLLICFCLFSINL